MKTPQGRPGGKAWREVKNVNWIRRFDPRSSRRHRGSMDQKEGSNYGVSLQGTGKFSGQSIGFNSVWMNIRTQGGPLRLLCCAFKLRVWVPLRTPNFICCIIISRPTFTTRMLATLPRCRLTSTHKNGQRRIWMTGLQRRQHWRKSQPPRQILRWASPQCFRGLINKSYS